MSWTPLLLAAGLAGCDSGAENAASVSIELYSANNEQRPSVLGPDSPVDKLEVAVYQARAADPASTLVFQEFDRSEGAGELDSLPHGQRYQFFVRGFSDADGPNGPARIFGGSAFFDVEEGEDVRVGVQVGEADCISLNVARQFDATGGNEDLSTQRVGFTLTDLGDGRVLAIGGGKLNASGALEQILDSMEIYDPARSQFVPLGQTFRLAKPRAYHSATALGDGNILIFGGLTVENRRAVPAREVEIVNVFAPDAPVKRLNTLVEATQARYRHEATLLAGGSVLITGGYGADEKPLGSTLRFFPSETGDPADGRLAAQGDLCTPRAWHSATRLKRTNELLAVAGGLSDDGTGPAVERKIEVFTVNPRQDGCCGGGTPSAERGCFVEPNGAALAEPRWGHSALAVDGGRQVLFVGGHGTADRRASVDLLEMLQMDTLKVRNLDADTMEPLVGRIELGRGEISATLLPDESVLLTGGRRGDATVAASSRLQPERPSAEQPVASFAERKLTDACVMSEARAEHRSILLSTGVVLLTGGVSGTTAQTVTLKRTELYFPRVPVLTQLVPTSPAP